MSGELDTEAAAENVVASGRRISSMGSSGEIIVRGPRSVRPSYQRTGRLRHGNRMRPEPVTGISAHQASHSPMVNQFVHELLVRSVEYDETLPPASLKRRISCAGSEEHFTPATRSFSSIRPNSPMDRLNPVSWGYYK